MGKDLDITTALLQILTTSLPVAWPLVRFTPPTGEDDMWLAVQDFPNEPDELSWNAEGSVFYQGFLQIEVHFRPTSGADGQRRFADAIAEAETIMGQYRKGTRAGLVGVSRRPWRSAAVKDEQGAFVPVTIPYSGIITQP